MSELTIERLRALVLLRADALEGDMNPPSLRRAARELVPEGFDWHLEWLDGRRAELVVWKLSAGTGRQP